MGFIAVYITHESQEEASRISEHLVRSKLAACANIFPIQSLYFWAAEMQRDSEWVSLVKTRPSLWERLKDEVELLHPYDVPCIARIEMQANEAYEDYILESTMDPESD
ncbi:MAG: divalent-cation tolerance protein CutA [Bacteroidetes bacterium]|nr:divalent-cation tolerance protein CutA [Bacteroidota bacterium]